MSENLVVKDDTKLDEIKKLGYELIDVTFFGGIDGSESVALKWLTDNPGYNFKIKVYSIKKNIWVYPYIDRKAGKVYAVADLEDLESALKAFHGIQEEQEEIAIGILLTDITDELKLALSPEMRDYIIKNIITKDLEINYELKYLDQTTMSYVYPYLEYGKVKTVKDIQELKRIRTSKGLDAGFLFKSGRRKTMRSRRKCKYGRKISCKNKPGRKRSRRRTGRTKRKSRRRTRRRSKKRTKRRTRRRTRRKSKRRTRRRN